MKQFDVIVIGSGPAGNTAAIYLVRSGFSVALFTGMEVGGQLITTTDVENFPGFPKGIKGFELMNLMLEQSKNLGANIFYDIIKKVDFSKQPYVCISENDEEFIAKNIIIATGASARYLGLKNERNLIGKGVSACATCDGNFYKNKIVAVVGGGNTAAVEALHLSHIAKEVNIIYRKDTFNRIEKNVLEKMDKMQNIKCIFNTEVLEIIGTNKLEKIKIINNKTNKIEEMPLDGLFMAIGRVPKTEIFKNSDLQMNEDGYIITASDSCRTNIKNVYACGDVNNKAIKQAVVAAGQGCITALELQEDN